MRERLEASFWDKAVRGGIDQCWPWLAAKDAQGYGNLAMPTSAPGERTRYRKAHRVAYELMVGPIPDGMEIDHVCHSWDRTCAAGRDCPHRACVNLAHLQVVTRAVNQARRRYRDPLERTHCKWGHPMTPENTSHLSSGYKKCKTCNRNRVNAANAAKRAALAGYAL